MRKLAVDFDFTILAPFIVFLLITLWNSIQAYRWPTEEMFERRPFLEEAKEYADWDGERQEQKRKAKTLIWVSAIALVFVCGLWLMGDRWKLNVAFLTWQLLRFISFFAFLFSVGSVWHYARIQQRWKLLACLLAVLITAASTEHFFHQTDNAGRIACPGCDDQNDGQ